MTIQELGLLIIGRGIYRAIIEETFPGRIHVIVGSEKSKKKMDLIRRSYFPASIAYSCSIDRCIIKNRKKDTIDYICFKQVPIEQVLIDINI